jgi:hypothetical protein
MAYRLNEVDGEYFGLDEIIANSWFFLQALGGAEVSLGSTAKNFDLTFSIND